MGDDVRRIDVEVTTPLNPTERRDRVEDAVSAFFPTAELEERHGELVGTAHSMVRLVEAIERQEIVDAARDVFLDGVQGDTFAFDLKKQAATQGVVNFVVDDPGELGELHVRVRVHEPSVGEFIDTIVPATSTGSDE